jgi:hypothetical protein
VFFFQVFNHPPQEFLHGRRPALRHWPVYELGLAAVAMRRDYHVARDRGSDVGSKLYSDKVEAGIDSGGGPCAGNDGSVLYIEDILIHYHRRIAARQILRVVPMGGASPAIKQARPGQRVSAGADGHHPRATGVSRPECIQDSFGDILVPPERRHDDKVRISSSLQSKVDVQGEAGLHSNVPRFRRAHPEVEGRNACATVGSIDSEDLKGRTELEDREVGDNYHGY